MTPGARIQSAIDVLGHWRRGEDGLDRVLTRWARGHRFAGSGDRHAIADTVYATLRRARSAQWVAGGGDAGSDLAAFSPRRAVIGSLCLTGADPLEVFTGIGHAPATLSPAEQRAVDAVDLRGACEVLAGAPEGVRDDLPDWLLTAGGVPSAARPALKDRAPVDLRVNRLKATPAEAARRLAAEGIETVPGPLSPDCLRVTHGARQVARSETYDEGLVEIQDAASQAVALLAPVRPGDTVLDYCAGGGGKALALAAIMAGRGRLVAHDADPGRMRDLPVRAARAGVSVELAEAGPPRDLAGACDVVFVDAPCSGSGAWRRNPDAKWRITTARLAELLEIQRDVLARAAEAVRPGGCLVYATCSMLEPENAGRVADFLAERAGWQAEGMALSLLPGEDRGDGFFAQRLRRAG